MPPGIGGRASRRGGKSAIVNGWSKFEPPIFFSLAREKKTGRSRSKRKERFERCGATLWLDTSINEKSKSTCLCAEPRCRCCGGRSGWFVFFRPPAAATAEREADQVSDGLLVSVPPSGSFPPGLTSVFFSFGPSTARFLFFFAKKKRKWGVEMGPAARKQLIIGGRQYVKY